MGTCYSNGGYIGGVHCISISHWLGCSLRNPATVITDRGSQFESELWRRMLIFWGTTRNRTTSYHPQSNGMVERFHRHLKDALKSQLHPYKWVDSLPLVLLGIRAAVKEDLQCSPVLASPRTPDNKRHFVPSALDSAEYMWIRRDGHGRPLQRPYSGPFKVISKLSKYFTVKGPCKEETVTLDRPKPAIVPSATDDNGPINSYQKPSEIYISATSPPPSPSPSSKVLYSPASTDFKSDPTKVESLPACPLKSEPHISFSDRTGTEQSPRGVITRSGRLSRPPDRYTSMVS